MKKVWLLVLCGLLLAPAAAESQTIRGVVVEDGTRTPIVGALVELVTADASRTATAQTDSAGAFLLRPRRSGRFIVRLSHLAYAPVSSDTLAVGSAEAVSIELRMARAAIPLEPLVVTARRSTRLDDFHERQRRNAFGRFLTRADIDARPGFRASELLRGMPGVTIVPIGGNVGMGNLITMRGGVGRCLPIIYIDGMPMRQLPQSGVDDFLSPMMIEAVEVYTSFASAPSPIHSPDNCGVVAFWTRSHEGGNRWTWRRLAIAAGGVALLLFMAR